MTTHREHIEHSEPRHGTYTQARCTRFGVAVLALVGIGLLGAVATSASNTASAHSGFGGWRDPKEPISREEIEAHAKDRIDWLAGAVNTTPEQRQQIELAVDGLIEELYPLMQQRRDNWLVFAGALAQPQLSRQAFDEWHETEQDLFERLSDKHFDSVFTIAQILTPEQRQSLADRLQH